MRSFSFKQTILSGIALALPLAIVGWVVYRVLHAFEQVVAPVAKKIGIETLFGEITLTILAVLCMLVLTFLLGLLMAFSFIANGRKALQATILKMVPSLNHLELLAAEKLQTGSAITSWKTVLIEIEEGFVPAYLVEETGTMATFSKVKMPGTEPGDILISKKEDIRYMEIPMAQFRQFNKQFGRGYISLIEK